MVGGEGEEGNGRILPKKSNIHRIKSNPLPGGFFRTLQNRPKL